MKFSNQRHIGLKLTLLLQICLINCASVTDSSEKRKLNIAVIGAGTSGLVSARHSIATGHDVTVYEQNSVLGGIWAYSDEVGKNQYGVYVHSPMYQGLRTNAPYRLMELPGLHFPNDTITYPPHSDVLKYLMSYADQFGVSRRIKFNHLVVRVLPIEHDKWEIIIKDLPNNKFITKIYDAVFVCNGHFFDRYSPRFEGVDKFEGKILHSHDFRTAEAFRDEKVLVVGMGPSGIDISMQLLNVSKSVTVSVKNRTVLGELSPEIVVSDKIKRFTANGVEFVDGSKESFTSVILATGYNYSYPFLSVDSGILVDDDFVQPLYKQIINIHHPTMAFVGIQKYIIVYHLYDLQVRFALKFFSGEKKLPSKPEMLEEYYESDRQTQIKWNMKWQLVPEFIQSQREYFSELSQLGDIENVPEVYNELALYAVSVFFQHPVEVRKYKITVTDDGHFTREWQGD